MQLLSFVIPCYGSEKTIEHVIKEITDTVSLRSGFAYEVICVNDASPDNVLTVLKKIASKDKNVKCIQSFA